MRQRRAPEQPERVAALTYVRLARALGVSMGSLLDEVQP
jgi:hypothetical protein